LLPKIFQSCDEFKKWFDKPIAKIQQSVKKINEEEKKAFQLTEEE